MELLVIIIILSLIFDSDHCIDQGPYPFSGCNMGSIL